MKTGTCRRLDWRGSLASEEYRITRHGGERWSVFVHGRNLVFDTVPDALHSVLLAARTDRLIGRDYSISVEQNDGTFREPNPEDYALGH